MSHTPSPLRLQLPDLPEGIGRTDPPNVGVYQGFDIYPMPTFLRLEVPHPAITARWYVDVLGFGVMYIAPEIDGIPMMVHLRRRRYQDILLVRARPEDDTTAGGGGGIHFDATGELERLAARAMAAGAAAEGPVETPYGPRELRLTDPHGHRLVFFAAPERPTGTIDEAMQRAAERMLGSVKS